MQRPVLAALLAAAAIILPAGAGAQAVDGQTVTVEGGTLHGTVDDGVIAFKGIPFAAPPVGDLRWQAPQPAQPWTGVREATEYGHDCAQLPFPSDAAPLGTPPAEDCLYANVWRPANGATKLPVLVWIYGGGFVNGGASPPTYSGAELAEQGILFFSFNYRLGRLGTFGHPQLTQEGAEGGLFNYNHMDQVAALRWVQRNIAAFGGDPQNVTIIGESAGGMSVHTLLTSPQTEGLFARAVIQSGGTGSNVGPGATVEALEATGTAFAETKGIAADDPQALAKLRALPAEEVVDGLNLANLGGARTAERPTLGRPVADGTVVANSMEAYRSSAYRQVPVMIGATSNDIGGRTGPMVRGARDAARMIAEDGQPTYYYRYSYVADSARAEAPDGAPHASEIPFFFHTEAAKYGEATTARDRQAGETVSAYLVNFVKTGDPNGAGLPQWPRYEAAGDSMMDFTGEGTAVAGPDPWRAEMDASPVPPAL